MPIIFIRRFWIAGLGCSDCNAICSYIFILMYTYIYTERVRKGQTESERGGESERERDKERWERHGYIDGDIWIYITDVHISHMYECKARE